MYCFQSFPSLEGLAHQMALLRTSITYLNSTQLSLCEQFLSTGLTCNFVEDQFLCPVDRHKTLNQYLFVMKHV